MALIDLMNSLIARGVCFTINGGGVRYRAPKGVLTPELKAELQAHKREVLCYLQQ